MWWSAAYGHAHIATKAPSTFECNNQQYVSTQSRDAVTDEIPGGGDKLVANGAAVNRRLPAGRERIRTHLDWLDNGSRRIVAM